MEPKNNIIHFAEFRREKAKREIQRHLQTSLGITLNEDSIDYLFDPDPYNEDKPCDTE